MVICVCAHGCADAVAAAVGILLYAQQTHRVQIKESWFEKLGRWEEALDSYSKSKGGSMASYTRHVCANM